MTFVFRFNSGSSVSINSLDGHHQNMGLPLRPLESLDIVTFLFINFMFFIARQVLFCWIL